jgi:uncharacterized delta-60 repeat protein
MLRKYYLCLGIILILGTQEVSAQIEEWVTRYDGPLQGEEVAYAIAVDDSGNVYIAGRGEREFATIKYNNIGAMTWMRRHPGAANDLAIDNSGNVYVTGGSVGPISDYATIKYSSSGDTLWVRNYDGPANSNDFAFAIVVDDSSNVYVTGRSRGNGTAYDIATIKYTSNGDTAWVNRYNGPGNGWDEASEISVDDSGNVYVTGRSQGIGTYFDIVTIKYSSSGIPLWTGRYNGPADSTDEASGLALDDSGNVYVTGKSWGGVFLYFDYITMKYSRNGDTLWVRRYNNPGGNKDDITTDLAVDGSGNVYVTGWSLSAGTNTNYITIKYNSSGDTLWMTIDGLGNSDVSQDLDVDALGNVYITGKSEGIGTDYDYVTIKYDSSGSSLWVRLYNGPANSTDELTALALDALGNVYVTGGSIGNGTKHDYATLKYNSSGDTVWVSRYNGSMGTYDRATLLAVDGSGSVCVSGFSMGPDNYDYATVKYDGTTGDSLWVRRYNGNGPINETDYAYDLAVDESGNVYVTGASAGANGWADYATIKYNSSGDTVWVRRYNNFPYNGTDVAYALDVDTVGNVYVTGGSQASGSGYDYLTFKYSNSGDELWMKRTSSPGDNVDLAYDIAVDDSGNVYVTGKRDGNSDPLITNFIFWTVKYNPSGNILWTDPYNGPGDSTDEVTALTLDAIGNVYVTGRSQGIGTGFDYATIKYSSSGNRLWVRRYNGPGNGEDSPSGLAVDDSGNIYITGWSSDVSSQTDYATIKYNSSGDTVWVRRYDGPAGGNDQARVLALDNFGNIYVTGSSEGFGTGSDYATIKYNPQGDLLSAMRHNGTRNGSDVAYALGLDSFGNVYVTGRSDNLETGVDYVTIKYSGWVGVEEEDINEKLIITNVKLYQNQPNPFNSSTTIRYVIPSTNPESSISRHVSLKIYDITGRLVKTLVNEKKEAGVYQIEWDGKDQGSGIYLYRLKLSDLTATKKLIMLR